MRLLFTLVAGAATSLALSCFLFVADPAIAFQKDESGGTNIVIKLANPNGPELSAVPAPPVEDLKPVPAPELTPLPESSDDSASPIQSAPAEIVKAQPANVGSPAVVVSKNSTPSAGVSKPTQTARAGQVGNRPTRTRTVVVYRDRPCSKDEVNGGWGQATQPQR